MNKKIFAVLCIFAVVMVGCAYATDSTVSSDNSTVTISGLNFTVPEGFTENADEEVVNESGEDGDYKYVTNEKVFESEDGFLIISVSTYEQNITDDYINDVGDEATIGNVTGYSNDLGIMALFSYIQDGKLVVIVANDNSTIEEVLS